MGIKNVVKMEKYHSYIYKVCGMLLLLASGCTSHSQDDVLRGESGETVSIRLAGTLPARGLDTKLCQFRRSAASTESFVLEKIYESVSDGLPLELGIGEMERSDYRFLAVAQPAGAEWMELSASDGTPLSQGIAWEELRLGTEGGAAALDGYGGVTDISGESLLAEGAVSLTLTRIAGQVLFDFFRTAGSLAQPEGVVSQDVASVIDRVAKIEITYEHPTTTLRFDDEGRMVPSAYASAPLIRTIEPAMEEFRVSIPQSDKGLELYNPDIRGGLRIMGAPLLPSAGKLRVKMVFTYYDTTPSCGNDHQGEHSTGCYALREVALRLPGTSTKEGLTVASDSYTVNRAGLRCDRIVDVPVGGGIETDFGWL